MNEKERDYLYERILLLAGPAQAFPIEVSPEWESWVARPCVDYMLAPREARAALEVMGFLASNGMSIRRVLHDLVEMKGPKAE